MSSEPKDFYIGYGPLPQKDRRFLLKAVPAGLVGLTGSAAFLGRQAVSSGGGRWETGTPVTLIGRLALDPYPTLWVDGQAVVLAGIGKRGTDHYTRPLSGQIVKATGVKIVRGDCFMLGVARGDIAALQSDPTPIIAPVPPREDLGPISFIGEVLDAQCFMGVMNPGYGRTHRGCAAQCIRGGQPVYVSPGMDHADNIGRKGCGDIGYVLSAPDGEVANKVVQGMIATPLIISGQLERQGNLKRLRLKPSGITRIG